MPICLRLLFLCLWKGAHMVAFPCLPGERTGGLWQAECHSKNQEEGLSRLLCPNSSFRARVLEAVLSRPPTPNPQGRWP